MIKFFKSNKTFTCCFLLTVIFFLGGIIFNSLISDSIKDEITKNINVLVNNFTKENYNLKLIFNTIFNNSTEIFLIWVFGISIIGIPIVISFYSLKVLLLGFEFISLLSNIKSLNFLFIIVYLFPMILNIGIFFILLYYSINYSLVLIRIVFFKKNYNLKAITNRYLKILLFTFLCGLVTALLESFVVPKILAIII